MMKIVTMLAMCGTVLAGAETFAQRPIVGDVQVEHVRVFRRGAELRCTASVTLPQGESVVVLRNIAKSPDEESLQVGSSQAGITVLQAQVARDYFKDDESQDLSETKAQRDRLKQAERELGALSRRSETLLAVLGKLDECPIAPDGTTSMTAENFDKLVGAQVRKRTELTDEIAKVNDEVTAKKKEIKRLRTELYGGQEETGDQAQRPVLLLRLASTHAGPVKLSVNYISQGAYWNPQYEIRSEGTNTPLRLTTRATLRQTTGVEWKNVKLSLVNGTPTSHNQLPELEPWFIHLASPANAMKKSGYVTEDDRLVTAMANYSVENEVAYDADEDESEPVGAGFEMESNQFSVSYEVATPYTIRSGQAETLVTLTQQQIPAEYQYIAAPNMNPEAYLVARVKDFSQYGLISAPATVVFDNMQVGRTYLDAAEQEGTLTVTLGVDPRIIIKREEVKDKTGQKFLSSTTERTLTYDLQLKNSKREPIKLEVRDRYPLTTNDAVHVELLQSSGATVDSEKGYMSWEVELASGESKSLRVSYKVKYPKGKTILGL
jgi:hypothetical protein